MPAQKLPRVASVSRRSPLGALLSRTLPSYGGPYRVGVCDIELPVPRKTFGTFTHKTLSNTEAGLAMETVFFSVFYPAEKTSSTQRALWFPR